MATLTSILYALQDQVNNIVYPNGTTHPSIINGDVKIRIGFPIPENLDIDLSNNISSVYIFDTSGERDVSRFSWAEWETLSVEDPTIFLNVIANNITISGTPTAGQTPVIVLNNNTLSPYAYTVATGNTLNDIAAALGALIPGATVANNVITVTTSVIKVGVSTPGIAVREVGRQHRLFSIKAYSYSPLVRNALGDAIADGLRTVPSFAIPGEYYWATLFYNKSPILDMFEKTKLFQREIKFYVEYATTQQKVFYTIKAAGAAYDRLSTF